MSIVSEEMLEMKVLAKVFTLAPMPMNLSSLMFILEMRHLLEMSSLLMGFGLPVLRILRQ
jgi:hypothetical protein